LAANQRIRSSRREERQKQALAPTDEADAPSCPAESTETPAVLSTSTGEIHGTLQLPAGCGGHPVALILAGSTVQPYLVSWFKYDPAVELAKIASPALVVQGTTDTQVGVDDAQTLAASNAATELLLVDGMCHTLKIATLDPADQQAAYSDPARPLATSLVTGLARFLDGVIGR
jgi:pimeloyl-ACP methyl ester carboxylesterase